MTVNTQQMFLRLWSDKGVKRDAANCKISLQAEKVNFRSKIMFDQLNVLFDRMSESSFTEDVIRMNEHWDHSLDAPQAAYKILQFPE